MELTLFFSIFIIGLSYGATACMFSCMPFLSPILLSNSNNTKESLSVILPFSLGRVFSYTIIAVVAYLSSVFVKQILDDNFVFSIILGSSTLLMGLYMLYKSFYSKNSCRHSSSLLKQPKLNKFGFFTIGATMSINPCAPIMALLAVAANSSNIYNSIGLGIFFGIGAVMFSILFYGFIVSKIIRGIMAEFSAYKNIVEKIAALILIVVGALVLSGNLAL